MKRAIGPAAVALLVSLWVVAAADADEKSLTIWWAQWDPAAGLQELSQDFTAETGVAVTVHQIPWGSYQDQVFLEYGNESTAFDIVVGDSQWIGRGATKGLYLELTDWIGGAIDLDGIHPLAKRYLMEYPTGSGKIWAAPCETDALGFAYRRDWFEDMQEQTTFRAKYGRELAPPQTWEQFRDIAEFFHRPASKRYGAALLSGRGYDSITMGFQPFLWAFGGAWGDPETFAVKGHLDTPAAAEGLQFMIELLKFSAPGGTNADYGGVLNAFTNGSTAMALNYFPFFPGIVEAMGDKVGFFVVPGHDGTRAISLGGQGMSISTKIPALQQALAKRFIAWFQQKSVQQKWITYPGAFTANKELLDSAAFRDAYPFNGTFAQSLDHLRDFWNVPVYNELLAVNARVLGEALDGSKTPQAALERLAMEHEMILRGAGLGR
ncbi:MAG: extracellular solute-binding protein [Candidatus Latescibacterota bacterium]|jgi:multiple sugar transport system substrate-binding protein